MIGKECERSLDDAVREATPYALDFRIVRADGTERSIHERGDIAFDAKTRRPLKLVGSVQDVTDRVLAQIQLRDANRNLAEKVHELEQRSQGNQSVERNDEHASVLQDVDEAFKEIGNVAEQLFPNWSGALSITTASRTAVETVVDWGIPVWRRARFRTRRLLGLAPRPARNRSVAVERDRPAVTST